MQGEQIRFRKDGLKTVGGIALVIHRKGPQSKTSLSNILRLSKSTISDLVDRMLRAGILKQEMDVSIDDRGTETSKRKKRKGQPDRPGRPESLYDLDCEWDAVKYWFQLQQIAGTRKPGELYEPLYALKLKQALRSTLDTITKECRSRKLEPLYKQFAICTIAYYLSQEIRVGCKIEFEDEDETLERVYRLGEQLDKINADIFLGS